LINADVASGQDVMELENDVTYLINPGSVGQPRDGDRRAAYAIYEPGARLVSLCRAEYDVASAQKKILDAGLPELLALRLGAGV
jgi:diadenosine tetraphosphatase ApaH/serine/threonine PP2A family protein phosphatase